MATSDHEALTDNICRDSIVSITAAVTVRRRMLLCGCFMVECLPLLNDDGGEAKNGIGSSPNGVAVQCVATERGETVPPALARRTGMTWCFNYSNTSAFGARAHITDSPNE